MSKYNITLLKGDGIGPEVTLATKKLVDSLGLDINWDVIDIDLSKVTANSDDVSRSFLDDSIFESIEKNRVVLKGPITTPIGIGFRSVNVLLRQKYDLYTNIRPICKINNLINSNVNITTDIDFVIFRENTEGLYVGVEHVISDEKVVAEKIVTKKGSRRIAVAAFEYAVKNKRPKVTVAHKANILKKCDGLFLDMVREVSKNYPQIILEEVIVDNMAMQIVMNPAQFSVIVTTNLYGDVLSDLSAGLIGGLGLVPGANIGKDMAIFEPVHGSAPDIAGKGMANPTACMLSAVLMLEHIGELDKATAMRNAVINTLEDPSSRTGDLGGDLSTMAFADAVIKNLLDRSDK